MKRLGAALFAGVLLSGSPTCADVIDLSTIKCKDFLTSSKEDISVTLAWLDAYYKDDNDPAIIDADKLVANSKKLALYCVAHPDFGLITATDELFGKD
jgi:acid stress chaperone HdeB